MSTKLQKKTFQIRLDIGWWKILSNLRTNSGQSFKTLVEYALSETYNGYETESELKKIFGKKKPKKYKFY
ncbi:hypothetical protein H6802_03885 [Candidatus Nomurabacteria bacterium]|uniref:Uncharacterized protein n=1 Tax=candidate division WWE3 bacterium TaxID=2053526 RepID=A0A955E0S3_UNCKA|nr:hypothetical protein [candidate division WWE3 bacterium]MCB9824062.1 hypothetical protein [Candidatus Nomurabacteria bacterium]MCB9826967.1 hypothetical protein [Candidatus Nomurabacteria bacterium]MCB9828003.1 hypothetical protein [Candidatus Nomurabacteria bacterium]HXK52844.1 hypothetical protein [bacterium]